MRTLVKIIDSILKMISGVFLIEIGKPYLKPTKDVVTEIMLFFRGIS